MKRRDKTYNSPRNIPDIGKILSNFINTSPEYKKLGEIAELISLWPEIVGEKLAKISSVMKLEKTTLLIKVSSSIWRNEFYYIEKEIKNKLNSKLGSKKIRKIMFF